MRTNIDIDDELLAETMRVTGQKTKKGAIEEAMRLVTRKARLKQAIDNLAGIGWDAGMTLDEMRSDREFAEDGTVFHRDDDQ
ncbi:MAG: type II toxin-antitoxin system VapB family antitoxin [Hyphomicrobiales bacterium]|nr:MAG: type II toxin-antitoxin system VapB family antitoxin [Hyphomicrobiales bacterium]